MFGLLTGAIGNALDIAESLLTEGELPTKRQIAKLIEDGVSIYAISEVTGFAVDAIEEIIKD